MKNLATSHLPLGVLLLLSGIRSTWAQVPANTNRVTLLALNQPPCTVPAASAVLTFKLAYQLAEAEQSAYGFAVSVKFQSTDPNRTFSIGREGQTTITARHDTLTITYPMAAVARVPGLLHPVTCYLYLHRYTAPGRSTVLAKTPPIVFQNCQ
ncbi:hypothetical protein HHL22_03825 [Hymenobacter sp. RP-2-7]|uniref:Uncharacterized protein n=1 Tax=Hymenobacter polaris TaxID=2682546 RepID=A0A7Y0ABK4_9BACT|nr:hypothetical protein [Hymenobacter polaris]NML64327.1 hypothetical protein [Hymenobacter polaris]